MQDESMMVQELEALASKALLALQQQEDLQNEAWMDAQQKLYRMVLSMTFDELEHIFEYSELHVVQALGMTLLFNFQDLNNCRDMMFELSRILLSWYQPDGALIRRIHKETLATTVENIYSSVIGSYLKRLFIGNQESRQMFERFLGTSNPQFLYHTLFNKINLISKDEETQWCRSFLDHQLFLIIFRELCLQVRDLSKQLEETILITGLHHLSVSRQEGFKYHIPHGWHRFAYIVLGSLQNIVQLMYDRSLDEALRDLLQRNIETEVIFMKPPKMVLELIFQAQLLDHLYYIFIQLVQTKSQHSLICCFNCIDKLIQLDCPSGFLAQLLAKNMEELSKIIKKFWQGNIRVHQNLVLVTKLLKTLVKSPNMKILVQETNVEQVANWFIMLQMLLVRLHSDIGSISNGNELFWNELELSTMISHLIQEYNLQMHLPRDIFLTCFQYFEELITISLQLNKISEEVIIEQIAVTCISLIRPYNINLHQLLEKLNFTDEHVMIELQEIFNIVIRGQDDQLMAARLKDWMKLTTHYSLPNNDY